MDIIVISSDSSCPPSPIPNCSVESPSREKNLNSEVPVCKRPVHTFSSSEDSNASYSQDESDKIYVPESSSKSHDFSNDDSGIESHKVTNSQKSYDSTQIKSICFGNSQDETNLEDLNGEKQNKGCKTTLKEKREKLREQRLKEREQKKSEKAREKTLKKVISAAQKANRPGECMKFIQVVIDRSLLTEEFGGDLLVALQTSEMQYNIQEQLTKNTITWVKTINSYQCDDNEEIVVTPNLKEENHVLVIMKTCELIDLVKTSKLRYHVQNIAKYYENKRLTLVIYKLEEYKRLQNLENHRKYKAQCRTGTAGNQKTSYHLQDYSMSILDRSLIEIQILENCSHRLIENPQDLGSLVAQFTKALAEKDFKLEKQQKEKEKLGWFASGDSRDVVKVDKNGYGLLRLWKQQLCQFNNVNLDIADAIVSLYPSPTSLIQAYKNCSTPKEGQELLQNIAVRRGAGPLSSVRRIGPDLSKKIYNFFSVENGEISLS